MAKNNNHNHTELVWEGKFDDSVDLPSKRKIEKVVLPFQTIEVINEPREGTLGRQELFSSGEKIKNWRNKLIWGDNKLVMSSLLKEFAGKINLIYIDPPFDVGADFSIKVKVGDEKITKQPSILEEKAYRDTWGKGTNSYLQMIYERLLLIEQLLSDKGSIYVHLDWRVAPYVRVVMDEVFKGLFRNEIAWRRGNINTNTASNQFPRNHDTILFYAKDGATYTRQLKPYSDTTMKMYKYDDKDGRGLYRLQSVRTYSEESIEKMEAEGKIVRKDDSIQFKQYLTDKEGVVVDDVWDDIPSLQGSSTERLEYDTQKPEKLLERIIQTSSKENDLIADFFCGSGTTGAVAEHLDRRWIMSDLGRFAIHTSRKRLMEVQRKLKEEGKEYYPFEILNLGKYERQHWQVVVVNVGKKTTESKKIAQYIKFIVELYRGEMVNGFNHLHGKKDSAFIHIGAVDAPITMNEIKEAVNECKKNKFTNLDVLGWEWEMGVNEEAVKWAKGQGVRLKLLQIPREVMDKKAVEEGDVKFFELNYVGVDTAKKGQEVKVKLKNFAIPSEELIPKDLRGRITNWSDYIDYWSVDWNYASKKDKEGNYIFENDWQTFRTKKNPKLELETSLHKYLKKGNYLILVKVIDIFGNDTSKVVEIKI